jgi:hypothetical protein
MEEKEAKFFHFYSCASTGQKFTRIKLVVGFFFLKQENGFKCFSVSLKKPSWAECYNLANGLPCSLCDSVRGV